MNMHRQRRMEPVERAWTTRLQLVALLGICSCACGRSALYDDSEKSVGVGTSRWAAGGSPNTVASHQQGGAIAAGGTSTVVPNGGTHASTPNAFGGALGLGGSTGGAGTSSVATFGGVAGAAPRCNTRDFFGTPMLPFSSANDGAAVKIIAAEDLNQDALPDLALYRNASVSVSLGVGQGKFGLWRSHSDWTAMASPVAVDLDNDGTIEVVAAFPAYNALKSFEGLGALSSTYGNNFGVPSQPNVRWVTVADVNGDGLADLVTSDGASYVQTLIHDGTATKYVEGTRIALTDSIGDLRAADFNADGLIDLVTIGTAGGISVYLGAQDGTFSKRVDTSSERLQSLSMGDLDADGYLDLVTTDNRTIVKWYGTGDGDFIPQPLIFAQVAAVKILDVDGDGLNDIVIAESPGRTLCMWPAAADGVSFSDATCTLTSGDPSDLAIADFDGDGANDIAVTSTDLAAVEFFHVGRDGFRDWGAKRRRTTTLAARAGTLEVADIDANGLLDVITVAAEKNYVAFHFGAGTAEFPRTKRLSLGNTARATTVGDFDNDGKLDVAIVTSDNTLAVPLPNQAVVATSALAESYDRIAAADLNGDHKLDLVLGLSGTTRGMAMLGHGDGKFTTGAHFMTGNPIADLAVGDLDADGVVDLAIATSSPLVEVARGSGTGSGRFPTFNRFSASAVGSRVAIADFNEDGIPDLVVGDEGSGMAVVTGRGKMNFDFTRTSLTGLPTRDMAVADFDGDGHLDVLSSDLASRALVLSFGNGDGTFAEPYVFSVGVVPSRIAIGDFNRDARLDIAMSDQSAAAFAVWLNLCEGM